ncbi:DUF1749-domain-containing protein, partial [Amniculicola lignicola CBS 123094]
MANPGILHSYTRKLVAFEHRPHPNPSSSLSSSTTPNASSSPSNTLLWIGGLGDGLLTVQYTSTLAKALPPDWRLVEVLLTSSYSGWSKGSVMRDAEEIAKCVEYFQALEARRGAKTVLMGHSTGANDIMEYLCGTAPSKTSKPQASETKDIDMDADDSSPPSPPSPPSRPHIHGAILQGGVSDRETWTDLCEKDGLMPSLEVTIQKAADLIAAGHGTEIMSRHGNVIAETWNKDLTAYRLHSLLSHGGDDDYFSSDLSEEVLRGTFGTIGKKGTAMMFLLGSLDPYMPARVDKEELLGRWTGIVRGSGGMVD